MCVCLLKRTGELGGDAMVDGFLPSLVSVERSGGLKYEQSFLNMGWIPVFDSESRWRRAI